MTAELVHVHVREVPVELWLRSQEHIAELQREFMLISADAQQDGDHPHVPQRLLTLIHDLNERYASFGAANEQLLFTAAADGVPSIDLDYDLPKDIPVAARQLNDMLDEADEFCRGGEHLLTLATPPDQLRFRRWFLDEMVRQVEGHEPMPWSAYPGD